MTRYPTLSVFAALFGSMVTAVALIVAVLQIVDAGLKDLTE